MIKFIGHLSITIATVCTIALYGSPLHAMVSNKQSLNSTALGIAYAIERYASQHADSGLAKTKLVSSGSGVEVDWRGKIPSPVRRITRNAKIKVRFIPVKYSRSELASAEREALKIPEQKLDAKPLMVEPLPDYSGIKPTVDRQSSQKRVLAIDRIPVKTQTRQAAGIPARTTDQLAQRRAICTRQNDCPAFQGGAVIQSGDPQTTQYPSCTTGFAVTDKDSGQQGILTARHCAINTTTGNYTPNLEWTTPEPWLVGTNTRENATSDAMMITGQSYIGYSYTGSYLSYTNIAVSGYASPAENQLVCGSGGFSGEDCALKITAVNIY